MKNFESNVESEVNLNTLAKSIYSESIEMGFNSNDYIKLMNEIMDMTINNHKIDSLNKIDEINKIPIKKKLPIETNNLKIRLYNTGIDEKIVKEWFKDDRNKRFLLSTTTKQNLDTSTFISNDKNIFATISLKNNKPIGLLALLNIDQKNKKGEMRKMIGEIGLRGKGYAKEASVVWLRYCSEVLGLNKIYINTIETNIQNISLNRNIGFKVEGLLKKECLIDNIEHDVLRMAYFSK